MQIRAMPIEKNGTGFPINAEDSSNFNCPASWCLEPQTQAVLAMNFSSPLPRAAARKVLSESREGEDGGRRPTSIGGTTGENFSGSNWLVNDWWLHLLCPCKKGRNADCSINISLN